MGFRCKKEKKKAAYLLGIKCIEIDENTRFNLCLTEQRSTQQRTTAATREVEEMERQSFTGAPIKAKAKANPADINPLLNHLKLSLSVTPELNTLTQNPPLTFGCSNKQQNETIDKIPLDMDDSRQQRRSKFYG